VLFLWFLRAHLGAGKIFLSVWRGLCLALITME
jgi:hypothetical protein